MKRAHSTRPGMFVPMIRFMSYCCSNKCVYNSRFGEESVRAFAAIFKLIGFPTNTLGIWC